MEQKMKKNRFNVLITIFVTLLIAAVLSTSFTSCLDSMNGETEDTTFALEITSYPNKTTYTKGETLDLSGLTVYAIYESGNKSLCNDYTTTPVVGEVLNTTGRQAVVVEKIIKTNRRIERYKATFYITVNN